MTYGLRDTHPETPYERHKVAFWLSATIVMCIAVVTVLGNGLVLFATYRNRNTGRLRHLDNAIISLALSDLLFGAIGIPCRVFHSYYIG